MSKIIIETKYYPALHGAINIVLAIFNESKLNPEVFIDKLNELKSNDLLKIRMGIIVYLLDQDEALTRKQIHKILGVKEGSKFSERYIDPLFAEPIDGSIPFIKKQLYERHVGRPRRDETRDSGRPSYSYSGDSDLKNVLQNLPQEQIDITKNTLTILNENNELKPRMIVIIHFVFGIIQSEKFPQFMEFIDRELEELDKTKKRMRKYAPKTSQKLSNLLLKYSSPLRSPKFDENVSQIRALDIDQVLGEHNSVLEHVIDEISHDFSQFIEEVIEFMCIPFGGDLLTEKIDAEHHTGKE